MWLPHLTLNDFYRFVGSAVVGWLANSVWGYYKHTFWIGFKAGIVATAKKGGPLTAEEQAALKVQVYNQIQADWNKKIKKLEGVIED